MLKKFKIIENALNVIEEKSDLTKNRLVAEVNKNLAILEETHIRDQRKIEILSEEAKLHRDTNRVFMETTTKLYVSTTNSS